MKSLSLYVDKWFITGAVNIDGNVTPLSLPNGEDRIWLFFHEDTANKRVLYGKSFENNYRDKELHYIGDVFPLIESDEHHFTRYDNRPEEMKEIFKVSNIFSHLREAINDDEGIDTYISFSADISDIARLKFIQELEEAKFNVVESVARISHLALEESKKRGVFSKDGLYLVLVATNDNMHFSLYQATENLFIRKNEGSLIGMGLDVRERALIESVVENVNRTARFLSTPEEYALEYKRQQRFANDWLTQIQSRRFNLPITLSDITFAVAPNNPYAVTVKSTDLDQRTEGLVDDIVRKIADFVKENNVQPHEIKGIAFIGNTFTNTKFSAAINARFVVAEDNLVTYRETELPKVVSVYSQIDCSQFSEATDKFVKDATTQAELNRQAREEEERRKAAEAKAKQQQEEKELRLKADKEYSNAIENVERLESDADYENMMEWANIALAHHPEDEYAKEKLSLAQRLLAEQRANKKQFDAILFSVKSAFNEGRWNDAVSQSDIALQLRPDSDDVKSIKKEAMRQLEIKEKVANYLNRADLFFAQKLYPEALKEVGKVLNLDSSNTEAKEIKRKIANAEAETQERIAMLKAQLAEHESNDDYQHAIKICQDLIDVDKVNQNEWMSRKSQLLVSEHKYNEIQTQKEILRSKIKTHLNNEEWELLIETCKEFPELTDEAYVKELIDKATHKIKIQKIQDKFNLAVENENWNEVISIFNSEASLRDSPGNNSIVKFARNQARINRVQKRRLNQIDQIVPETQDTNNTGNHPRPPKGGKRIMPNTLLEDSADFTDINNNRRQLPRPKTSSVESKDTEKIESNNTTNKRKYPPIKRKNR
ncbi:MAG: hypothetical protein NC453_22005 [Muribaculum sp.]|nr:hypothetical protein [Muribaculum sp.]